MWDNLKSMAMGAVMLLGIILAWLHDLWVRFWYGDRGNKRRRP